MTNDEKREEAIRLLGEKFLMCSGIERQREIWADLAVLIKERSADQVTRMEADRGLC